MCTCTPATSRPASRARASASSACSGGRPNFDPSCAVRIDGCVFASTPGVTRTRIRAHARFCRPLHFVERVDDHEARACTRGCLQLFVALVVPVHDEPLPGQPGKERELELAQGRDVRAQPLGGEQPENGRVRERLHPVDDERVRGSGSVRAGGAYDRALLVDEERRPVLGCERGEPDPADRQLAVHDRGRLGEELEHRGHLAYDLQPVSRDV